MVTKERQAELARSHYEANKDLYKARARAYRLAHPEARARQQRRGRLKKLGLTEALAAALLVAQNNLCAICSCSLTKERGPSSACLDHSHLSGKVRGYLCNRCNRAIGLLQDDPRILRLAADYLERHQCP